MQPRFYSPFGLSTQIQQNRNGIWQGFSHIVLIAFYAKSVGLDSGAGAYNVCKRLLSFVPREAYKSLLLPPLCLQEDKLYAIVVVLLAGGTLLLASFGVYSKMTRLQNPFFWQCLHF